jgi:hypothetical protein
MSLHISLFLLLPRAPICQDCVFLCTLLLFCFGCLLFGAWTLCHARGIRTFQRATRPEAALARLEWASVKNRTIGFARLGDCGFGRELEKIMLLGPCGG